MGWVNKIYKKSERVVTRSSYTRRSATGLGYTASKVTNWLRHATLSHRYHMKQRSTEMIRIWGQGQRSNIQEIVARGELGLTSLYSSGLQPPIIKSRKRGQSQRWSKLPKGLWQDWTSVRPLCCSGLQPPGHQVAKKRRPVYWIMHRVRLFCESGSEYRSEFLMTKNL